MESVRRSNKTREVPKKHVMKISRLIKQDKVKLREQQSSSVERKLNGQEKVLDRFIDATPKPDLERFAERFAELRLEKDSVPKEISLLWMRSEAVRFNRSETREYVTQFITPELDKKVGAALKKLKYFQDRVRHTMPMKARSKRRIVLGFRETLKFLKANKIKAVFMARNIDYLRSSLEPIVRQLLEECKDRDIPVIFTMSVGRFSEAIEEKSHRRISVVGLIRAQGAEGFIAEVLKMAETQRQEWIDAFCSCPSFRNERNESPLWIAAYYGYDMCIEGCLKDSRSLEDCDSKEGRTPLLVSAMAGHARCTAILLAHGAEITARSFRGETAAYLASQNDHLPVLRQLVEHRADLNKPTWGGVSPVAIATQNSHPKCVSFLIRNGATRPIPPELPATADDKPPS